MAAFHEVRFPTAISFGSTGGPGRRTDVVTLRSGSEERNAVWASSLRRYDAGYGVRTAADLAAVVAFWEERRGRLYGFRWKDQMDFASAPPGTAVTAMDQASGTGDGTTKAFQLVTTYASAYAPWTRMIAKPVAGTVLIAVGGVAVVSGWVGNLTRGLVTFTAAPGGGGGGDGGVPVRRAVRFDTDQLTINMSHFQAGRSSRSRWWRYVADLRRLRCRAAPSYTSLLE